jgi:hypothetical protein
MDPSTLRLFMISVCAIVVALLLNVGFTLWTEHNGDARWCAVLNTLNDSDKQINAQTAKEKKLGTDGYNLIEEFRKLQPALGCGQAPLQKKG